MVKPPNAAGVHWQPTKSAATQLASLRHSQALFRSFRHVGCSEASITSCKRHIAQNVLSGLLLGSVVAAAPFCEPPFAYGRIPTDAMVTLESVPRVPDAEELLGARVAGSRRGMSSSSGSQGMSTVQAQVKAVVALNDKAQEAAERGNYELALSCYSRIVSDYPDLAISEYARLRQALMLYQVGRVSDAILVLDDEEVALRGYAEVHAALASVLYTERPSQIGRAEEQWDLAMDFDKRYTNPTWVQHNKSWPPRMMAALVKFLELR